MPLEGLRRLVAIEAKALVESANLPSAMKPRNDAGDPRPNILREIRIIDNDSIIVSHGFVDYCAVTRAYRRHVKSKRLNARDQGLAFNRVQNAIDRRDAGCK